MKPIVTEKQILEALAGVKDPELHRSLTDLKMVRDVQVRGDMVEVTIALTMLNCPLKDQIESDVRTAIVALPEVEVSVCDGWRGTA